MYTLNIDYNIEHIPVRYMDSIDIRDIIPGNHSIND